MSEFSYSGLENHTVGNYLLLKELGRGNNGVVYLAKQQLFERNVACKLLLPELVNSPGYVEDFMREARNAAKLDHPNIVQALDAGCADGVYYFIMEFVDGITLDELHRRHPERVSPRMLLNISIQLADALACAHSRFSMIHGDIKPENMLITRNNQLKLADLGLARVSGMTSEDDVMATPMYVSPEVIMQNPQIPPDQRSDIYSFGVMFYELSCGTTPFNGTVESLLQQHLDITPPPMLQQNPDMDPELARYIDSMLAKNMDERPANWEEVGQKLSAIRARLYPLQLTPAVSLQSAIAEEEARRQKVPEMPAKWFLILAVLVLVLVTGLTLFVLTR